MFLMMRAWILDTLTGPTLCAGEGDVMNYPALMSFRLWNFKEGHKQDFCPKINIFKETYSIL